MKTLRLLVLLARTLVILTIALGGAAVLDSLLAEHWRGIRVSISRVN